jgi:hypothetical protein
MGLPLSSLELELGPSQVEAVFDATDAMTAADNMVMFRSAVRMALRRAGYHASFVCRPPFPNIMSSGWHLHHSVIDRVTGRNAFTREEPSPGTTALDAQHTLSAVGAQWLAGLLENAPALAALCSPTVNAYGRFRPNALAPQAVLWGRDIRGAMLRVVGGVKQLELGEELAQRASRLGQPAEALSVIEDAYAAGQMGKGGQAAAHQTLRDQVRKQAEAERADRAAAEASAKTAPNGNGLVDLGWAMVAGLPSGAPAAQLEPGLALMEQGIAKGGLRRPVEARLHLAMGQLAAGRKDAARQTLKALEAEAKTDPLAVPVQLWSMFAQAPAMLPTRQ